MYPPSFQSKGNMMLVCPCNGFGESKGTPSSCSINFINVALRLKMARSQESDMGKFSVREKYIASSLPSMRFMRHSRLSENVGLGLLVYWNSMSLDVFSSLGLRICFITIFSTPWPLPYSPWFPSNLFPCQTPATRGLRNAPKRIPSSKLKQRTKRFSMTMIT